MHARMVEHANKSVMIRMLFACKWPDVLVNMTWRCLQIQRFVIWFRCPSDYTGTRCETPLNLISQESSTAPNGVTNYGAFKGSTRQPRCNFTIGVNNDGAFTARFRVVYSIDGQVQPELKSSNMPWIGQKRTIEIPHFATDIHVFLERYGFYWTVIHEDTGISTDAYCTKCYKIWGAVTHPKWDYLECWFDFLLFFTCYFENLRVCLSKIWSFYFLFTAVDFEFTLRSYWFKFFYGSLKNLQWYLLFLKLCKVVKLFLLCNLNFFEIKFLLK